MHYQLIPQELRDFRQWLCWKYENVGRPKLTKTPYSPVSGLLIDVTNPHNLSSFEQALDNVHLFDGIGFSLLPTDPFCFIDFDSTTEPAEIEFQKSILDTFDTYSEISPSGTGLHLICKAALPSGRRFGATEIYTSGRYMTMTGNVYQNKPIGFKQTLASALWEELGRSTASGMQLDDYNEFSEKTDLEIYNIAQYAQNGEKFLRLWNGDINSYHAGDHSRADFALVDILAFYTQDREQIKRLFRLSGLGQRQKAKREDYLETMISRAFDRLLPAIDISAITNSVNDFLAQQPKPELYRVAEQIVSIDNAELFTQENRTPKPLTEDTIEINHIPKSVDDGAFSIPPGLLGQIAKFIYDQAYKPIPEIAIVGAIGLLAGIAGRSYNVSSNGLNVYMLILAGTGRGKEAIASGINKIIKAVQPIMPTIIDFVGPQDVASGQGLLRFMAEHPTKSFVSVMGEFGIKLRTICDPKAMGADLMTQKVMLDMFSKSGKSQTIMPTVYSDSDKNTKPIDSPAFSLIGETQPSWFYNSLDDVWIRTGLLPRFTVTEYLGLRPPSNENCNEVIPSQSLIQNVCSLATAVYKLMQAGQPYPVQFTPEAMELSRRLDKECDKRINASDDIIAELWSRCHLKVLRLAALIAVGNNPYNPIIDLEAFEWAEKFIRYGTEKLASKFSNGIPTDSPDESHQLQILTEYILKYLASDDFTKWKNYNVTDVMFKTRAIPYSLMTLIASRNKVFSNDKIGGTNAVKRAIQNLLDNGDLQEIPKGQAMQRFDFGGRLFVVPNGSGIYEQLKAKLHLTD